MSDYQPPAEEWNYDYVSDTEPTNAVEGESWYDSANNRAWVFTDDAGSKTELTVTDHAQLSGVVEDAHHSRPTGTKSGGMADLSVAGSTGSLSNPGLLVDGDTGSGSEQFDSAQIVDFDVSDPVDAVRAYLTTAGGPLQIVDENGSEITAVDNPEVGWNDLLLPRTVYSPIRVKNNSTSSIEVSEVTARLAFGHVHVVQ